MNPLKKLERSLSLVAVIAISIGGMLGSGIFVLPGLAASKTGSSLWLAYLISSICILPAALSKSELATAMPASGGTYVYIERTFGPLFGTIAGIGLWFSLLFKSAFALVGFGAYLLVFVHLPYEVTKYIALIFLLLIGIINIFGIKKVGRVQLFIVLLSLGGLFTLLVLSFTKISPEVHEPYLLHGYYGLIETVAFVFVSYAGVTKIAAIAGEIKNPDKNLPRGMMIALVLVTLVYVSITYITVNHIPFNVLKSDIKPIYTLATYLGSPALGIAAGILGVITLFSMANSGVLASSRFPFAMAHDKLLPGFISKIHIKYLTPVNSILLTCIVMAAVILFMDVEKIAKLASAFMVLMFMLVNASVIVLRETAVQWYKPTYHSPLYPLTQIFGIVSGIVLLIFLGWMPILVIILMILIGMIIFMAYGNKHMVRTGLIKKYGHRPAALMLKKKTDSSVNVKKASYLPSKNYLTERLESNAYTVVPLFGNERSPEMIVEIAAAINADKMLQVVYFKEIPDHTQLDIINLATPKINSIYRRINAVAEEKSLNISFEPTVTHNLSDTIHALSDQTTCRWMVAGWNGRAHNGILIKNPLGWLLTHLNSNFGLFKDSGVRYFRKILLPLRAGRDVTNFISIAVQIGRFYQAELCLLHVLPQTTDNASLEKIRNSTQSMIDKFDYPCKLMLESSDDPRSAIHMISANFDLLIIGTPLRDNWISVLFGSGRDKIAENSTCSVLRLSLK